MRAPVIRGMISIIKNGRRRHSQNSATREKRVRAPRVRMDEGDSGKVEYASLPRWDPELRFIAILFSHYIV